MWPHYSEVPHCRSAMPRQSSPRTCHRRGDRSAAIGQSQWYGPARYAAMNKNPLTSLKELGFPEFPLPQSFDGATYAKYNQVITDLAGWCGFQSLGQVDQFLNYVYWKLKKGQKKKTAA